MTTQRTVCSVQYCSTFVSPGGGRGLCQLHYMRLRRTGTTATNPTPHARRNPILCTHTDCNRKSVAFGLCDRHYRQVRKAKIVKALRVCKWCPNTIALDAGNRTTHCPRCAKLRLKMRPYAGYFTVADYLEMYEKQEGRCGCCGEHSAVLDIDHCHNSQRIRGLLCGRCNTAIGFLGDTLEGVERAVAYLR